MDKHVEECRRKQSEHNIVSIKVLDGNLAIVAGKEIYHPTITITAEELKEAHGKNLNRI